MSEVNNVDTIAAIATPPGKGGIGVVRVSGPRASKVAQSLIGHIPKPRYAEYTPFSSKEGQVLDAGIALYFPSPNSFTGEDVFELQGHGGPVVMDMILAEIFSLGIRPANAGEFSERAFLNNKIDLLQAEAIADLIDAGSKEAAQSALRSLSGDFSLKIAQLCERVIDLRLHVESAIDFPEEEIDFLADRQISLKLEKIECELTQLILSAQQGSLIREGMQVVIAGEPNAGKSSLLNALACEDRAIVTDMAGTTRDLLDLEIQIDGLPIHIIDTAGLRNAADRVEQEGIRRAKKAMSQADRILLVHDDNINSQTDLSPILKESVPKNKLITHIHNKIDLSQRAPELVEEDGITRIYLSAKDSLGIDLLRTHLKECMGYTGVGDGLFMARRRHLEILHSATLSLSRINQYLKNGIGELVAEELRLIQQSLGEITGEFTANDLLGKIFTSFCIGK